MMQNLTAVFLDDDTFEERLTAFLESNSTRLVIQGDIRLTRDSVLELCEALESIRRVMRD